MRKKITWEETRNIETRRFFFCDTTCQFFHRHSNKDATCSIESIADDGTHDVQSELKCARGLFWRTEWCKQHSIPKPEQTA